MVITIIFESHATTTDNENGIASGHNDVDLCPLGLEQAEHMGARNAERDIAAIYTSDLQRAYKSAIIAFSARRIPFYIDRRLRECDYGDLTRHSASEIKVHRASCIENSFPNGESYEQCCARVTSCLRDIAARHKDGDTIIIIGHRATQYGLEYALKGVSVFDAVTAPWEWQPGWTYELNKEPNK